MANICNPNTQRAYSQAACRSSVCEPGLRELAHVKPPHIATYIEMLELP